MRDSDVDAAVELTLANYDGVLAEHHSAEVLAGLRAELTPEFFRDQMTWKQVFVAEDEGQVVATGALADFGTSDAPKYTVSMFFVRSDLHRHGIGSRLLDHLTAAAVETGADKLHVPSSHNAIPFYVHAGFAVDTLQPDAEQEITWMTKPL
jgi:GNAT superfamily N-acetyltransferase